MWQSRAASGRPWLWIVPNGIAVRSSTASLGRPVFVPAGWKKPLQRPSGHGGGRKRQRRLRHCGRSPRRPPAQGALAAAKAPNPQPFLAIDAQQLLVAGCDACPRKQVAHATVAEPAPLRRQFAQQGSVLRPRQTQMRRSAALNRFPTAGVVHDGLQAGFAHLHARTERCGTVHRGRAAFVAQRNEAAALVSLAV